MYILCFLSIEAAGNEMDVASTTRSLHSHIEEGDQIGDTSLPPLASKYFEVSSVFKDFWVWGLFRKCGLAEKTENIWRL